MLMKWCVLGAPLHKGQLPSQHIGNILKWPKRTFSNMPYSQYPRNWFVMDLSCDKPYIYISSLILYKNLLFPAMYSRLERARPDRIVAHLCVIWVQRDPLSLIWTCWACVLILIALWKPVCFVDCCYWIQEVPSDLRRSKPDSLHPSSNHIPLIFDARSQVDYWTPKQTFRTTLN